MNIQYFSTRNRELRKSCEEILLEGLSADGGLYLPSDLPDFSSKLKDWKNLPYPELATEILHPFLDELPKQELSELCQVSYANFDSSEIAPMVRKGNQMILELFHGPTLAFKDFALQLLGNLFETSLAKNGQNLNILGATSGDTGSAAIHAVKGKKSIRIFILYPKGRVSAVQELQMTAVQNPNVHVLAIDGTFDDAQSIVKQLLNDPDLNRERNLGAVNSINFVRILAQTVYYFYAYFRFQEYYPGKIPSFSVPTGNFGNVYAGYLAKKMGLPCSRLIVAVNENDILGRCLTSGEYIPKEVQPTIAPSMDIQVSSNFERLLFDLSRGSDRVVREKMRLLKDGKGFVLSGEELQTAQKNFFPVKIEQEQVKKTIREFFEKESYIPDTHSAIGIAAAQKIGAEYCISLATAHPAKFEETLKDILPAQALQKHASIEALRFKEKSCHTISADVTEVKNYVLQNTPPKSKFGN